MLDPQIDSTTVGCWQVADRCESSGGQGYLMTRRKELKKASGVSRGSSASRQVSRYGKKDTKIKRKSLLPNLRASGKGFSAVATRKKSSHATGSYTPSSVSRSRSRSKTHLSSGRASMKRKSLSSSHSNTRRGISVRGKKTVSKRGSSARSNASGKKRNLRGSSKLQKKSLKGSHSSTVASDGRSTQYRSFHPVTHHNPLAAQLERIEEDQTSARLAIIQEEELEHEEYTPLYNVFVMAMIRLRIEQVNEQQQLLNTTFQKLRDEGVNVREGDSIENVLDKLRHKLHSEAVEEVQELKAENRSLLERLKEKSLDLDRKTADIEVLRQTMARKMARTEIENNHIRDEIKSALCASSLDVDHMKKELCRHIDIATASLRTPTYGTALRAFQEMQAHAQTEIQEHHDRFTKLIVSLGAVDTFSKDTSETMHSNFPVQYRTGLRELSKDHLINILDVLSFQEGVVDTVGKALFVLNESAHRTAVL